MACFGIAVLLTTVRLIRRSSVGVSHSLRHHTLVLPSITSSLDSQT